MPASNVITYQPFKALWTLGVVLTTAARLPFWVVWLLASSNRPNPRWTFKQALGTKILRTALWNFCMVRVSTPLILSPKSKEKAFLVPIPPSSKPGAYVGICDDDFIKPTTICGYWYPSAYSKSEDKGKKVVLHFHGGAFVIGDCRPSESGYAASLLTKNIGKTLMVSYRLSSNTGGRFPAALQDAVSSLHYLFDLGIESSNIVIGGDSAGGNLAVALLRYLEGTPDVSPLGGALLWSPWVDLASSVKPNAMASSPYQWTDYVGDAFASWGCAAYCPKGTPVSIEDGWISPRRHPFHTKTPVWIQGSGQEVLIDDITAFAEGMQRIPGNNVTFHVEELANHDIILVGNATGFDKEAENAAKVAAQWVKQQ